jgi:hypothetical protein
MLEQIYTNALFVSAYFLLPILFYRVLLYNRISLKYFSITSLFVIFYFIYAYIGIFPLYFYLDEYKYGLGVVNRDIIIKMFLFTIISFTFIVVGFISSNRVFNKNKYKSLYIKNINSTSLRKTSMKQNYMIVILLFYCMYILYQFTSNVESIALFEIFSNDETASYFARSKMGNDFSGKLWRYQLFFRHLLNYCVMFLFSNYLMSKTKSKYVLFIFSFLIATFSSLMSIEKSPFIGLMIMLYLSYLMHGDRSYLQKRSVYYASVGILATIGLFYFFMNQETVLISITSVVSRVLTGQIATAYFYIEVFPQQHDFLYGLSFPNPGGIFAFDPFPLTKYISNIIFPMNIRNGLIGSAPSVFWAEIYANFGVMGIPIFAFMVGFSLRSLDLYIDRWQTSSAKIATYVILSWHYRTLTGSSISNFLFDSTLFAIIVIAIILISVRKSRYE